MAVEMKSPVLHGLVLAGGRSSRMKKDKGLISYHNKPQREHLFELLSQCCEYVFTSCRKEQKIPSSLNPIYDAFNLESPLNGILSTFEKHLNVAWLAVAVDMPYVNENVLQFLIAHRNPAKVATCFYDSDGKLPEPLLTIWEPSAFIPLKTFWKEGGISPREFLIGHECEKLQYHDPQFHININTPEELGGMSELPQKN